MGDHDRLDKGFVNWQGTRVFVPWFGPLRTVPSGADELHILKLRGRAHVVMAIGILPTLALLAVAASLLRPVFGHIPPGDHTVITVMLCLVAVFGFCWLLERRQYRHWPELAVGRRAFLLSYYRTLPVSELLGAVLWSGVGVLLCVCGFVNYVETLSSFGILCALVGPVPLGIVAGEHVVALLRAFHHLPADLGRS